MNLKISIHSLRMEGDIVSRCSPSSSCISIHSLRMEGDNNLFRRRCDVFISIHSLRMEGDPLSSVSARISNVFQSTPSAWRETSVICYQSFLTYYFNPLPPHGGRLFQE